MKKTLPNVLSADLIENITFNYFYNKTRKYKKWLVKVALRGNLKGLLPENI